MSTLAAASCDSDSSGKVEEKKPLKPCCACPETKKARDAWASQRTDWVFELFRLELGLNKTIKLPTDPRTQKRNLSSKVLVSSDAGASSSVVHLLSVENSLPMPINASAALLFGELPRILRD